MQEFNVFVIITLYLLQNNNFFLFLLFAHMNCLWQQEKQKPNRVTPYISKYKLYLD